MFAFQMAKSFNRYNKPLTVAPAAVRPREREASLVFVMPAFFLYDARGEASATLALSASRSLGPSLEMSALLAAP